MTKVEVTELAQSLLRLYLQAQAESDWKACGTIRKVLETITLDILHPRSFGKADLFISTFNSMELPE